MKHFLLWCGMGLLTILLALFAKAVHAGEPRRLCTWDIAYYLLGERHQSISKQAWLLSDQEEAQLFGPFMVGAVYVDPGKASFTCDGKRYEIITRPLPQGSLLLLKK